MARNWWGDSPRYRSEYTKLVKKYWYVCKICVLIQKCIQTQGMHACVYLFTLIYIILSNVFIIIQLVQQKDGVQTELTRMSLAKIKLESLCRELQKHSKAVVVSELCIRVTSYLRTYIVHLFIPFYALHNVHRVQYTGVVCALPIYGLL